MNDPFVLKQANGWAMQALEQTKSAEDRVRWMYQSAFARPPTDSEVAIAKSFLGEQPDVQQWRDFAHALINTKEFIFLR